MSSTFPPLGEAPSRPSHCQRCRAPLPPNDLLCRNCGYQNGAVQNMGSGFNMQSSQQASNMSGSFPNMQRPTAQSVSVAQNFSSSTFNASPSAMSNRLSGSFSPGDQPVSAPVSRKRPRIGIIVTLVGLILLVVMGAMFATGVLTVDNGGSPQSSTSPKVIPTPGGPPLFADDFASNKNGWVVQSYPGKFNVAVGGNALTLEDDNHSMLWEMVPGKSGHGTIYNDFKLFVDAVQSKGDQENGYGVLLRGVLDQNGDDFSSFYRFSLYGDGSYAIFKGTADANGNINNKTLVDYTANSAIQPAGGVNHIVIDAKGSTMTFSVNGQTLNTINDNSFASGLIALFVNNLQDSKTVGQAKFSHLSIYPAQSK